MAGIPYVGPHVAASAVAMDKTLTKLVVDHAGVPQAAWKLVRRGELTNHMENTLTALENRFAYPMFVKPAGTGSSVGVSKAADRDALRKALEFAAKYDDKILVEEFIHGREIEVAVMGNANPVASIAGEIDSGADFYDYDAKYVTDTSVAYIPARIPEDVEEIVREAAVKVYSAIGCQGLSRVDFFVTYEENRVVFNEINTLPGFTSISMYPKLFAASGIPYAELIDQLLELAMEAGV
jgi:D-alanine-D-alanine ligase